jgi:hypothetical protein
MVTRAALTDQFARVNGRPIINKRKKAIKILEVPAAGSTLSERFGLVTVQLEGDRGTPHGDSGLFFFLHAPSMTRFLKSVWIT